MRKILFMCFAVFGIMLSQTMMAQPKTVTGAVVDATSNETLPGVNVTVKGTTRGVGTDLNGRYSISVSPGEILVFSFLGFTEQEIPVGAPNQINVRLLPDVQALGEVVITAEFGMKRISRAIGSSVQNVRAQDIVDSGRDNFITALQGRVAGMNVTSTSGAPGSSTSVVLRSVTSISGNNQPLYVVDGVPMNNTTFDPLQLNQTSELYSVRNLDFASRGNDFNPEDIESVTILKGAAAAALYGSNASNGAIIITTKKGVAGRGKVSYSNTFRWDNAYGFPELQEKYANGAYGTTNYYFTSRYGGLYPQGTTLYDNVAAVTQTGYTSRHNMSVEGGSDKVTLRASASTLDQKGVIKTSEYSRLNLSLAGRAEVKRWMTVEATMQYASTNHNKVPIGTSGPLYMAMRWPMVDDMSQYLDADGSRMRMPEYYTDTDLLNTLFGMYKNKLYDESDRFISNAAVNFTPIENTFLRVQMGWDVGMQTFIQSRHPYYANNNNGPGIYNIAKANFSDPTINILGGYSNQFFEDKLSFTAQFGYHQVENKVSNVTTNGSRFAVADLQSINNVDPLTINSSQRNTRRRVQAFSGQMEFGFMNMAFLTFRGRNDWSSTLPYDNRMYFYPAVEAAFILSELSVFENIDQINYLKLRGSLARVGRDALPLEIDPQLQATGLVGGGYKYGFTGPNRKLRPEMTTSREFGFETRLFDDRINADFTYFKTYCADQIVKGFRLSYATGFVLNNMNVGTFETWGWESHIDGDIVRTSRGLRWNVGLNMSSTDSEIVYLPPNVTEYYNPYTWNSGNIRNGIMLGHPITTLTGRAYLRNDAGDVLISPTSGLPLVSPSWSIIGNREPKLRFGITSTLNYMGFRLNAMFAGRYKTTVVNGTKRTMMANGISMESVTLREAGPVVFKGVLQDGNQNTANPTPNNMAVNYDLFGTSIYAGGDEDWLEKDVNYIRLQELRLSYNLPAALLNRMPFQTASVFVSGNDLLTWTNYSGIDAVGNTVSAAAGGSGGEGIDVWSLPMPRGISVGIAVTFK